MLKVDSMVRGHVLDPSHKEHYRSYISVVYHVNGGLDRIGIEFDDGVDMREFLRKLPKSAIRTKDRVIPYHSIEHIDVHDCLYADSSVVTLLE